MALLEFIVRRCHRRIAVLLVGDIATSLILLWLLFYEQYADRWLFQLEADAQRNNDEQQTNGNRQAPLSSCTVLLASCQSCVFTIQVFAAALSFIMSLLSSHDAGFSIDTHNSPT
jgi:hypothetical protein